NSLEVAKRKQDEARLAYEEAVNGATKEERAIAQTNVVKAQASVDTIKAQVDELVRGLKVGDRFTMRAPALGDQPITAEIKLIAARRIRRLARNARDRRF